MLYRGKYGSPQAVVCHWVRVKKRSPLQLESYWFTPKVSKRTMDVHPAIALAAVFVGVGLFGPIGALIGIPVAAAVVTILETFRRRHELLPELEALRDDVPAHEEEPTAEGEDAETGAMRRAAATAERIDTPAGKD